MSSGVKPGKYFVQGDEAIAEGAIAAGCRFFAGYPITPSSETSETMARRLPEVGGVCLQMEDELASIHAIGGASVGGLKAMTISSGPGISLKLEGLGWGIKNEIPYVVVDIQRAGPSNGVATRVGQGDFYTVRYGSAGGNSCTIALSPKSTQEAFDLTIECFNLAEIFRCPVFLLSDETVGHTRELLVIPEESELKVVKRIKPTVPPEEFLMYPLDTPGVIHYPFPNIGEGYGICVSPYTHTSKGYASTAQDIQEKMAKRLVYKVTREPGQAGPGGNAEDGRCRIRRNRLRGKCPPGDGGRGNGPGKGHEGGVLPPDHRLALPRRRSPEGRGEGEKHPGLRAEHRRPAHPGGRPGGQRQGRSVPIWVREAWNPIFPRRSSTR